jgi:dTDP-4-dehydrorhamnose 3,5-epimerase
LQDEHGFTFTRLALPEVILVQARRFSDARGSVEELFRQQLFRDNGIDASFVQENLSCSRPGTLRGLHYQLPPHGQAKLVTVLSGAIYDVAVDLRPSSPTFLKHVGVQLSAETCRSLFVPAGFAHGFCVVSPGDAYVSYKLGALYYPQAERGIRWDDPDLCIQWPPNSAGWVISERDKALPRVAEADPFE